jgi:hypothetical protein
MDQLDLDVAAEFVVMALGLQFADHHQRYDHLMFGEPRTRPGVG